MYCYWYTNKRNLPTCFCSSFKNKSHMLVGIYPCTASLKTIWQLLKWLNLGLWYDPAIPLYIYSQEKKNTFTQKPVMLWIMLWITWITWMFKAALFTIAERWTQLKISINHWTDKQNVAYAYKGLLLSHEKKWSTDTRYSVDEPWQHYAEWKKPDTRDHILYDSIYIKCLGQANP